jgi:uncharacterized protein (TIGR00255 family)
MISSMTAFSRKQRHQDWGNLTWELRSVNHRYLEPTFKLPDSLRHIEPLLREQLKQHAARGKFDCVLKVVAQTRAGSGLHINQEILGELMQATAELDRLHGRWAKLNPLDILQWPGLLQQEEDDNDQIAQAACEVYELALQQLDSVRQREGAELATIILQRLDAIELQLTQLRHRLPEILSNQRQRLLKKLEEISADLDVNRLEQELVYAAQKADVDEELDRLDTHIKEVRRILKQGGSCGRRLDFLMQELNREANTLSSKSMTADTTLAAVELKVLIEQMREQVQNIE